MSSIDRDFSEKRNFIRMRINSDVNLESNGQQYTGICRDISGSGLLVETQQAFTLGDEVRISIPQKSETHLPFNATTEVTRVSNGSEDRYIIGFSIIELLE
jgi:hypothetical protein